MKPLISIVLFLVSLSFMSVDAHSYSGGKSFGGQHVAKGIGFKGRGFKGHGFKGSGFKGRGFQRRGFRGRGFQSRGFQGRGFHGGKKFKYGKYSGFAKQRNFRARNRNAFVGGLVAGSLGALYLNNYYKSKPYVNKQTHFFRDEFGTCFKKSFNVKYGWLSEKVPSQYCN